MNKLTATLLIFLLPLLLLAQEESRLFIYGHSLLDHRPPAIPTPNDETTVAYWLGQFNTAANRTYAAGGQYGFLPNHDDLNPIPNWGWEGVTGVWDFDVETYAEANINTIINTAANFIQNEARPAEPHPLDPSTTVLQSTQTIYNWVAENTQENTRYYIYECWPEMFLQNDYPPIVPTDAEVLSYHNETTGEFHNWWIEYQDSMLLRLPELQPRLIPAGSVMSKVLRDVIPGQVPFTELYEDSAPHGRANLYFLASVVVYMALYEEDLPADYDPGDIVHPGIRNNLADIRAFIWQELQDFNDASGGSRVFYGLPSSLTNEVASIHENIKVFPNPAQEQITITAEESIQRIDVINTNGQVVGSLSVNSNSVVLSIPGLASGLYTIRIQGLSGQLSSRRFVKR